MPETPKAESTKARRKSDSAPAVDTFLNTNFPVNFAQIQLRNAAALTRVNEILADAAKAVWENETALFRLETEAAREAFAPLKNGEAPAAAFSNLVEQWHRNSAKALEHVRAINDVVLDCEWQLLSLAADNITTAHKEASA